MRFVTTKRGGMTDDRGIEGLVMEGEGELAIRAGETDILISHRDGQLVIKTYAIGDYHNVWSSMGHFDTDIMAWALSD